MRYILISVMLMFSSGQVFATSGSGCYRVVNVAYDDVLNIRSRPSARSSIVYTLDPAGGPIISGGRSAYDAQRQCIPTYRRLSSRWCPVTIYDGNNSVRGWAKRRFLQPNDCP